MNKIFKFLAVSNCRKHLIEGFTIATLMFYVLF